MKLLFVSLVLPFVICSQENYSSLSSNYMPTNSVLINPSSMLDAKTRLDINIVSLAGFVMNNLVYLDNISLNSYISEKQYEAPIDPQLNLNRRKYHVYNRLNIQGPSFVFSQGDHAFGLGLGVKSYSHLRNMPQDLIRGVASFERPEDKSINASRISLASIVYGDAKLSYAYTFFKKKRELFMVGISLSKFFPFQSTNSKVNEMRGEVLNDSTGYVFDVDIDNAILLANKVRFSSGFGLDVGFTYERMLSESFHYYPNSSKNNCRRNYYLYKIGISIMDIGKLKFEEDDIDYTGVKASNYDFERQEFSGDNLDVFNQLLEKEVVINDPSASAVKKMTAVRLPTYISLQGDYNAWRNQLYVNLTWVQRFPLLSNKFGVSRANSIALTPRYERKFFEVALPISLYEYQYPQIGVMFRFWFMTIGTDKLVPFLFDSDVYGADIYFALKIPIVYHPKCRDGKRDQINYYPKRYRWKSRSCNGM